MHLEFKKFRGEMLLSLVFHILVQDESKFILYWILISFWIWDMIIFFSYFLVTKEAWTILACYFYKLWANRIFITGLFSRVLNPYAQLLYSSFFFFKFSLLNIEDFLFPSINYRNILYLKILISEIYMLIHLQYHCILTHFSLINSSK